LHHKLGENIAHVRLRIALKDTATGSMVLTIKDKAEVAKLRGQFARELAEMKAGTAEDAIRDAKLRPLVPFFAGVTMKSAGLTVTFEGKAEPGALLPLLTEGAFPFHFFQ